MNSEVFVVDDLPPETVAMLQALYSRSPNSVVEHLDVVKKRGADQFMATYYVGYNHRSIGDCGTTTLFIEGVSMLAAKAIQDWPLYSGQEASTRYLDMTKQPVLNPLGTTEGAAIQAEWMRLYVCALDELVPKLKERFPRQAGEDEKVWAKAIKAKAFDVARSLLPAGATTYVSWHSNLRQCHDHLKELRNHPLGEVGFVAEGLHERLMERYPSSFGHKFHAEEDAYIEASMKQFAFRGTIPCRGSSWDFAADFSKLDTYWLREQVELLRSRPPRAELHQRFRQYGTITFTFPLDFGSYRDLQRQRSVVQEMPLLTTNLGFHPWYLAQLDLDGFHAEIAALQRRVEALDCGDLTRQYYVAMGYLVPVRITGPLPAMVYVAELRSQQTVHSTLRRPAQQMGDALEANVPGLAMHHDRSPDAWSVKRGTQDIVAKEKA